MTELTNFNWQSLTRTSTQAVERVTTATDKVVDSVTAKVGQFKNTTSEAMQTAISSAVSDWLQTHPAALKLVQILVWASDHPIISLVIFLLSVAIAWSLIRAIGRLIDAVGWALLQAPFKLSLALVGISFTSLGKFGYLFNRLAVAKATEMPPASQNLSDAQKPDQQQRLAEILTKLEAIRQEQNKLLQEAAAIISLADNQ